MNEIYISNGSIVTGDEFNLNHHWNICKNGKSFLNPLPAEYGADGYANLISDTHWQLLRVFYPGIQSKCALLCFESINRVLQNSTIDLKETLIIISTTKGDIDLLNRKESEPSYLWQISKAVDSYFNTINPSVVISTACISGNVAIQLAAGYLLSGKFKNVIVCGVDLVTRFTTTGFNSLKALSPEAVKPFDVDRNGISLGEGAASILLTMDQLTFLDSKSFIKYKGGFTTNDANHISGPSRNGEGLLLALEKLKSTLDSEPDFIGLHGTGTLFNDDMEAQALTRSGFSHVPVWGQKGIYGHTFGLAGVLETILCCLAMVNNLIPATAGFKSPGTELPLNILSSNLDMSIQSFIKCTSGFGGGNSVLAFQKEVL